NFERWPFDDLDVLDPRLRRRILSDDGAAKEQAARRGGARPYREQSIHRTNPLSLPLKVEGGVGVDCGPQTVPVPALWNRFRPRHRRDLADIRCAGEFSKAPSGDKGLITLVECRLTRPRDRARTGKGIDVLVGADGGVAWVETIGHRHQEGNDLVLLQIC